MFKLLILVFIFIFNLKDTSEERLKKEKKEWKRKLGREYEDSN